MAADRDEEQDLAGGDLEVAVPVRADGQDVVVRAALPYSDVLDRTWITFAVMAGLAVAVLAFSWALARRRAARIAAPLEEMTRAAHALGAGDFAIEPGPAAIYEAAEAGRALQATARRLGALLEQARSAAADASHQVRTPLTALRLGLERVLITPGRRPGHRDPGGAAAGRPGRGHGHRAAGPVRDPLAPVEPIEVAAVMESARTGRWAELARARAGALRDRCVEPGLPAAAATTAVLNQVLDVLVTNALEHGAGTVTVAVRTAGGGVAVDVRDEGAGFDAAVLDGAFRRGEPAGPGQRDRAGPGPRPGRVDRRPARPSPTRAGARSSRCCCRSGRRRILDRWLSCSWSRTTRTSATSWRPRWPPRATRSAGPAPGGPRSTTSAGPSGSTWCCSTSACRTSTAPRSAGGCGPG